MKLRSLVVAIALLMWDGNAVKKWWFMTYETMQECKNAEEAFLGYKPKLSGCSKMEPEVVERIIKFGPQVTWEWSS